MGDLASFQRAVIGSPGVSRSPIIREEVDNCILFKSECFYFVVNSSDGIVQGGNHGVIDTLVFVLHLGELIIIFLGRLKGDMRCAKRNIEKKGGVPVLLQKVDCLIPYRKCEVFLLSDDLVVSPDSCRGSSLHVPLKTGTEVILDEILISLCLLRRGIQRKRTIKSILIVKSPLVWNLCFPFSEMPFPDDRCFIPCCSHQLSKINFRKRNPLFGNLPFSRVIGTGDHLPVTQKVCIFSCCIFNKVGGIKFHRLRFKSISLLILTGQDGCPGWRADRCCYIGILKQYPFFRQLVDMWCLNMRGAISRNLIFPQIISHDQDNIRPGYTRWLIPDRIQQ